VVDRLKESRWVVYRDEALEQIAVRLGVRAELLQEAQRELDEEARRDGALPTRLGTGSGRYDDLPALEIVLPKVVFRDWAQYCASRDLPHAVVLRSLVHRLLSSPKQPSWVDGKWRYRGKYYSICQERHHGRGRFVTAVACKVSHGAHRALALRARHHRHRPSALMRGAIIDLLEGRAGTFQLCSQVNEMWDDPQRYWLQGER